MWSEGALPVFDGLVTSLVSQSPPKMLKGVVVLTLFLIAIVLLYRSLRSRFWLGVATCVATVAMTVVLNQHEVWAVVRFGRWLMVPLAYFGFVGLGLPSRWTVPALISAFVLGIVSTFGFAAYHAGLLGGRIPDGSP
jgi:hypothetical protein